MVLNILRSKKVAKRVLLALLILIIPAFVLWGVGNLSNRPAPIGKISGKNITIEDIQKSLKGIKAQVIMTYFGDLSAANSLLQNRQLVNYMAWERLVLLDEARRQKINISNDALMSYIASHPLFQRNGAFNQDVYQYILRNNFGMDPRQFEEMLRDNIKVKMIRQKIVGDLAVSDEEALAFYKNANDKVKLSYFLVNKDRFAKDLPVSNKEIEELYAANRASFMEPEKVEAEYIELPYESADERRTVMETLSAEYPAIKASGSDFLKTADAMGFKSGKTGAFSMQDMIPGIKFSKGLQETVFRLKVGEISPPVFTATDKGAVYIFRKVREIPGKAISIEEVREDIAADIRDAKGRKAATEEAVVKLDAISDGKMSFEEAARSVGSTVNKSDELTIDSYLDNVGPAKAVVLQAREKGAGQYLAPIPVKNGAVLIYVDEIIPAKKAAFEKEKDNLKLRLLAAKQMEAMDVWFNNNSKRFKLYQDLQQL